MPVGECEWSSANLFRQTDADFSCEHNRLLSVLFDDEMTAGIDCYCGCGFPDTVTNDGNGFAQKMDKGTMYYPNGNYLDIEEGKNL